ncbi:MAG: YfhO family protein [Gemmatimonadetes bacterium]|nr:YfhO family protein [Gemmatimonadota bacterium]
MPIDDVRRDYRYRASRFDTLSGTLPVLARVPLEPQKWYWQQIVGPNVGQPWRVLQQDAWDAIKLRRTEDERDLLRVLDLERRWKLLRLQSVRYVHSVFPVEFEPFAREIELDSLAGHLYELHEPLPRAYVVSQHTTASDEVESINRVLEPEFDLHRSVVITAASDAAPFASPLVEGERASAPGASLAGGADRDGQPASGGESRVGPAEPTFPGATIVESSGTRVRVRLDASVEGFLVLTDSHYPGWTAHVDGARRDIELANYFFRAVPVAPGDREVVFTYRSSAFTLGARLSGASLIGAVVLWVSLALRDRRRRGAGLPV